MLNSALSAAEKTDFRMRKEKNHKDEKIYPTKVNKVDPCKEILTQLSISDIDY